MMFFNMGGVIAQSSEQGICFPFNKSAITYVCDGSVENAHTEKPGKSVV